MTARPTALALLGRLQRGECPLLDIVDGRGETLASSYAAIERQRRSRRGADQAFARVEALLLRALAGQASPIPPTGPQRPPARYSRRAGAQGRRAAAGGRGCWRRSGGRARPGHWNIALRRDDGRARSRRLRSRRLAAAAGRSGRSSTPIPSSSRRAGQSWLFAEAYPYATGKGVIVCAPLSGEGEAGPFRDRAGAALAPLLSLCLPRMAARSGWCPRARPRRRRASTAPPTFPDGWVLERRLFQDQRLVDATFFEHDGRLWLFAGGRRHMAARTGTSSSPGTRRRSTGPWTAARGSTRSSPIAAAPGPAAGRCGSTAGCSARAALRALLWRGPGLARRSGR